MWAVGCSMLTCGLLAFALTFATVNGRTYNLQTQGAVPNDPTLATANKNGAVFNSTLDLLVDGDTIVIPTGTFHMQGGVMSQNKAGITLMFDGTVVLADDIDAWPRSGPSTKVHRGHVLEFMKFSNYSRFTISSSNTNTGTRGANAGSGGSGLIDGRGNTWWGLPGVGYLEYGENRPRMLHLENCVDVLIENIYFKDPPYWTTYLESSNGLEVRNCRIEATRAKTNPTSHSAVDLTAFNTDGFDFSGTNIYIHDSTVWNQDDSFCIKDRTSNVLVENINASGLGLTIGSVASNISNITFRNAHMQKSVKGIYMKFRGAGHITDVLYENIVMDEPEQYPIWIGPAQQSDSDSPCAPHPCSLCWPSDKSAQCNAPADAFYARITLRNITINKPGGNAGVILANVSSPMVDVLFDNVLINEPHTHSPPYWGTGYLCEGVASGRAIGNTHPVPHCFTDATTNINTNV